MTLGTPHYLRVIEHACVEVRCSDLPKGADYEAAAAHIEKASTHWMRHTAGTHQSDRMDLKAVRDNLGHANIATTSVYLHTDDDQRHDLTTGSHRVGWSAP